MSEEVAMRHLIAAIEDLSRITIALGGKFESKADAVRQLSDLGIPPVRIAGLLAVPPKSVHAELVKARHRKIRGRRQGRK